MAHPRGRIDTSRAQWGRLARRGIVRPELVPGGAGWSPYLQAGGTPSAPRAGGSTRRLSRACGPALVVDANGTTVLRAMRAIRDEVGHAPGIRRARWQRAHDLEADGIVGAATLRAMGLAP